MKTNIWMASAMTILLGMSAGSAEAQINKIKDLDPTNKNSKIRESARDIDKRRLDEMSGTPYVFTIQNPTKHGVHLRINGMPYLIMANEGTTFRGRGTPEIRFDNGTGSGSMQIYTLHSGRTYYFKWVPVSLGSPYDSVRNALDLYGK